METNTKMEPTKVSPLRVNTVRIFSLASALLLTMIITVMCIGFLMSYEVATEVSSIEDIPYWKDKLPPEQQLWYDEAIEELQLALKRDLRKQLADNAIIFLTSGIDTETMAAARALLANRTKPQTVLSWERFPHLGRLKVVWQIIIFFFVLLVKRNLYIFRIVAAARIFVIHSLQPAPFLMVCAPTFVSVDSILVCCFAIAQLRQMLVIM